MKWASVVVQSFSETLCTSLDCSSKCIAVRHFFGHGSLVSGSKSFLTAVKVETSNNIRRHASQLLEDDWPAPFSALRRGILSRARGRIGAMFQNW